MKNKITIIGVTGRKYSGKDTIANKILQSVMYDTDIYCFKYGMANPARAIGEILGFTEEEMLDPELKEQPSRELGIIWRDFAKWFLNDMMKDELKKHWPHIDDGIWVRLAERNILNESQWSDKNLAVISDIRFDVEAEFIKKYNGIIIHVRRPDEYIDTHVSESGISEAYIDYRVVNDGTIENLEEKIDVILDELKTGAIL
jgi:hypothetical protein